MRASSHEERITCDRATDLCLSLLAARSTGLQLRPDENHRPLSRGHAGERFDKPALGNRAVAALADEAKQLAAHGHKVSDLALDLSQMLASDPVDNAASSS